MTEVWGPRCPNHKVKLVLTNDPGVGICPISNFCFTYDAEADIKTAKLKITAMGTMAKEPDWKVKPIGEGEK